MSKRKRPLIRKSAKTAGQRGNGAARSSRPRVHSKPANGGRPSSVKEGRQSEAARQGRTWLYGVHPVLAAFANPRRRCLRLLLTAEADQSMGPRIAALADHRTDSPEPEIVARDAIDRVLPRGAAHQGVAIQVEGLEDADIEAICRAMDVQGNGRVLVLDQVTDPHNVGAVLRSAAAFGAAAVIVPERNSPFASGTIAKAAAGALETVPLVRVVNLARALETLKKSGFWCVGFDGSAQTPLPEADLSGKIALVLGAEGEGLRRLTREHCDLMVRIPISAGMESLNVSNAAAIALYELARRG